MATPLDQKQPLGPPQAMGHNPLYYPSQQLPFDGLDGSYRRRDRSCTPKRFFKALLFAGSAFLVLRTLSHSTLSIAHYHQGRLSLKKAWEDTHIPDNVAVSHCVGPDDWEDVTDSLYSDFSQRLSRFPYKSKSRFDIPLAPDTLWFLTKGAWSAGSVDIVTSPDQAKDKISYEVVVHYYEEEIRDIAKVCLVNNKDAKNQEGVGIFTPRRREHRRREDNLLFETTITFPELDDGSPLTIKNFVTDLFATAVRTSTLADKIHFKKIDWEANFSPVSVTTLTVNEGKIHGSITPIRGHFNTTGSLELITSNADIKADVVATSKKDGPEPSVLLQTSNAPVHGVFHLVSPDGAPGTFHIEATTKNSPLDIRFEDASVGSVLDFKGTTANSPAKVKLHPTYEGSFLAETSWFFKAEVSVDNDEKDPSGKGRQRKVRFEGENSGQKKQGYVVWGDEEKKKLKGIVDIKTSLSPVEIHL